MTVTSAIVFAAVVLSWFAFVIVFATRKAAPQTSHRKRDSRSITGIVFQGLAYALIWAVHRPYFSSLVGSHKLLESVVGLFTVLIAIGSVVLTMKAVNALGKEWSLRAQVIEGHKLATQGPYAWVRHPIYTGMLGMLISTALAVSYWPVLLVAVALF